MCTKKRIQMIGSILVMVANERVYMCLCLQSIHSHRFYVYLKCLNCKWNTSFILDPKKKIEVPSILTRVKYSWILTCKCFACANVRTLVNGSVLFTKPLQLEFHFWAHIYSLSHIVNIISCISNSHFFCYERRYTASTQH